MISASGSMNFRMSHGHAIRSVFGCSRVTHCMAMPPGVHASSRGQCPPGGMLGHHGSVSHQADDAALPNQTLTSLREALGPSQVLTDPDLRATYETDWTRRFHGEPAAVARPRTVGEGSARPAAS